jgi:hypothetical protein
MIYQLLIAIGVIPISMVWGGRYTDLTAGLRIASIVAIIILGLFMVIIRRRAGLISTGEIKMPIKILSWVVTAYMAFNTLGNFASQSAVEQFILTPITAILTIVCFIVSISKIRRG